MRASTIQRQQTACVAPAANGQPRINSVCVDADCVGPVRNAFGDPALDNPSGFLRVAGLLARSAPPTIARLIVSMHVFAVEAVFGRRAVAEFCVKLIKRCIEKLNAPAAVRWVGRAGRVCASAIRPIVGVVLRGVGHPVSGIPQNGLFALPAPAGSNSFRPFEHCRAYGNNIAALTLTDPPGAPVRGVVVTQDQQAPKSLTGQVDKTRAAWNGRNNNSILFAVHSVFSYQKIVWARAVARLTFSRRPVFIIPHDLIGGHYIAQ
jgi:hypothetical protein